MSFTTDNSSSKLFHFLASLIAERDGIHPAHAENRIRAASRLLATIESTGESTEILSGDWEWRRNVVAQRAAVQASAATWAVAAQIHDAEMAALEMMA